MEKTLVSVSLGRTNEMPPLFAKLKFIIKTFKFIHRISAPLQSISQAVARLLSHGLAPGLAPVIDS